MNNSISENIYDVKKIRTFYLIIFFLLSLRLFLCDTAYARTFGDYEYKVLDNGTVEISKWKGSGTSAVIPSEIDGKSVTSIGEEAFYRCSSLTEISIPNSVTSIGRQAFVECDGLTEITIPNSVTSIGNEAFLICDGITEISIPSSVTSIGDCAFFGCSGLTNISVDVGNTEYDSRDGCNAIIKTSTNELIAGCKNTVIPSSVTSIGYGAFCGCLGLTEISIPSSVTSIKAFAFYCCDNLNTVFYSGTRGDFETIDIQVNNERLKNAKIYYNGYHCIYLDSQNGDSIIEQYYNDGDTFIMPADPEREGYDFGGWYTGQNGSGTQYTSSTRINANATLYAYWTVKNCTITFYPENGNASSTSTVTWGSNFSKPADPTKEGYDFQGWYTGQNGSGTQYTSSTRINANATLYAYWTVKTCTITFYPENGENSFTRSVTWGSTFSAPDDPVYEGHDFWGWYTERNGAGTGYDSSTIISSDVSLYAKWMQLSVEIPKGYVKMVGVNAVDKSSLTVKVEGNVLDDTSYTINNVYLYPNKTRVNFTVLATYNGEDYSVNCGNVKTSYDLSIYSVRGMPENITVQDHSGEYRAINNALRDVVLENEYETMSEKGSSTYTVSFEIFVDTTGPVEERLALVTLNAYGLYSFGGSTTVNYRIPIIVDESGGNGPGNGNEDNSPPEDPQPADPASEQPPQTTEPEKNDNRMTITASSGDYKVVISMNSIVPYTKDKKAVVSSLDITSTIVDTDGNPCGIYIKSTKATKPKNGITKVTFKLKGSNKPEKKAVKVMNKSLKKIRVDVEQQQSTE